MDVSNLPYDMIPAQKEGNTSDTISEKTFGSITEAADFFEQAKTLLLDVNKWKSIAGKAFASFQLTDADGIEVNRLAGVDDFFKINIPGPDNPSGDGYDWVRVEEINTVAGQEGKAYFVMTIRPAVAPKNEDKDVAHFFNEAATNTFLLSLSHKTVSVSVHGRNEKPNIKSVAANDVVRNALIAVAGIFGLSKIQWEALTDGILRQSV